MVLRVFFAVVGAWASTLSLSAQPEVLREGVAVLDAAELVKQMLRLTQSSRWQTTVPVRE